MRKRIHVILSRPEKGGNVGSAARALANMGIRGELLIVGNPQILDSHAYKMAKHAAPRFETIRFYSTLAEALASLPQERNLRLAATARIGSAHRPHPTTVREAMQRAVGKLRDGDAEALTFVFGPESDGLSNEEVALCDWVVTIPSAPDYRSLNLAQAILIFSYEAHLNVLSAQEEAARRAAPEDAARPSQKEKLVSHMLAAAEAVGFILPGDPFKMRPRLEEIFARLPRYLPEAKTLHGLLDQTIRSARRGEPDFKGRYRHQQEQTQELKPES